MIGLIANLGVLVFFAGLSAAFAWTVGHVEEHDRPQKKSKQRLV